MMNIAWEDIIKLFLAVLMGGFIGAEREYRDKAAGFRTLILISVGAALFTMLSLKLGGANNGTRIAANIVSGVGFLGAGVILRDAGRVIGLTTASSIWLTAALGMGIGGGYYWLSGAAVALILLVLWVFPFIEQKIHILSDQHTYDVVCCGKAEKFVELSASARQVGLRQREFKQARSGKEMHWTWVFSGSPDAHERFVQLLMGDDEIDEFRY